MKLRNPINIWSLSQLPGNAKEAQTWPCSQWFSEVVFSFKWHQSVYDTTPELLWGVFCTQRYSAHEFAPLLLRYSIKLAFRFKKQQQKAAFLDHHCIDNMPEERGVKFPMQQALDQAWHSLVCFQPSEPCIFVCHTTVKTARLVTPSNSCSLTCSLSLQTGHYDSRVTQAHTYTHSSLWLAVWRQPHAALLETENHTRNNEHRVSQSHTIRTAFQTQGGQR